MDKISILGSGWLGLPLAKQFIENGYQVNASTTSCNRIGELVTNGIEPFIIDIDNQTGDIDSFLDANILIINIPSKNIEGFTYLIKAIKSSDIENIIFISSTSVYKDVNRELFESDIDYLLQCPLIAIENLFMSISNLKTTVVRFGGLIGYSRHPGNFFTHGRKINNPDAPVNLIHRDDCIGILSQIVEQQLWNEVLNACADTHPTKQQFYTRAVTSLGKVAPEFEDSNYHRGKVISNQKLKKLLKYNFKHPDLMQITF